MDLAPWSPTNNCKRPLPNQRNRARRGQHELLHVELSVDRESTLDELVGFIKGLSGGQPSVIIPDGGLCDVLSKIGFGQ